MNSDKIYTGEDFSFFRQKEHLGRGGNGAVYDVTLTSSKTQEINYPLVAKFFEYEGVNKAKRYSRFKNEVRVLKDHEDLDGIIKVVDKYCPENVPKNKDEAWYLMPKAKEYKFHKRNPIKKLEDMLSLAYTLQKLHNKKLAHRDIKPGNILVLDGKLVLSDFGLVWGVDDERITEENESIGPYKIMPPELEHVQLDMNLEFMPSDVYLFAKVLWMNFKNDYIGFRGRYNRSDAQIYLDKHQYDVCTLEPIHKLLEMATCDDMRDRITIDKCIEYLILQQKIFNEPQLLPRQLIERLQYEEESRRMVETIKPDEHVYVDKAKIHTMLKAVIHKAVIRVKDIRSSDEKEIKITKCTLLSNGTFQFLFHVNGRRVNEYLANVQKMTYNISEESMVLELDDFIMENSDYTPYGKNVMMSFKEYFSKSEQIIILKP